MVADLGGGRREKLVHRALFFVIPGYADERFAGAGEDQLVGELVVVADADLILLRLHPLAEVCDKRRRPKRSGGLGAGFGEMEPGGFAAGSVIAGVSLAWCSCSCARRGASISAPGSCPHLLADVLGDPGGVQRIQKLVRFGRVVGDSRRHPEEDVGLVHVAGEEEGAGAFRGDGNAGAGMVAGAVLKLTFSPLARSKYSWSGVMLTPRMRMDWS